MQRRPPIHLVIEPTNHCNRSCPVCGAAQSRKQTNKGYMDWGLFKSLAEQAAALRPETVCLYSRGESLLHDRILEMIAKLSALGLKVQLTTNSDLLDPETSSGLINAGLNEIIISHPSISEDNYKACTGQDLSFEGEDRLCEALAKWEGAGKVVCLRCLVIPEIVKGKSRDVTGYLNRWLSVPGTTHAQFTRYQPWPSHVIEEYLPFIFGHTPPCPLLKQGLTVFWDGKISPCSFDVHGDLALGKAQEISLKKAYNSESLRRLRRNSLLRLKKRQPPLCRSCLVNRIFSPVENVEQANIPQGKNRESWFDITGKRIWKNLIIKAAASKK